MDYMSVESEFIESLNYLRPPVKRTYGPNQKVFGYGQRHEVFDSQLVDPSSSCEYSDRTGIQSSTSLILHKYSEKIINLQPQTSLYSSQDWRNFLKRSHSKNKPIIKVTVIPKLNKPKHSRKRRQHPKRIQSSLSNQENSVTNDLYLVIAGEDKDKIYKIKATESAILSSDKVENVSYKYCNKNDDISFEDLCNFKMLMKSLNMDGIRKACNKATCKAKTGRPNDQRNGRNVGKSNCRCKYESSKLDDKNGGPKIKHFKLLGEFGIDDKDSPVLQCGPMSNDDPDPTEVTQVLRCELTPEVPVSTQAGYPPWYNEYYQDPLRTETQSTQVNFNASLSHAMVNKTTQCCCVEEKMVEIHLDDEQINNTDCDSPLVIVSVFRKPSPNECCECYKISVDDNIPTRPDDRQDRSEHKSRDRTNTKPLISEKRTPGSRSPTKKTSINKIKDEQIEARVIKTIFNTTKSNKINNKGISQLQETNKTKRKPNIDGAASPIRPPMGDRQQNINIKSGFKYKHPLTSPPRYKNDIISNSVNTKDNNQFFNKDSENTNDRVENRVPNFYEYQRFNNKSNYYEKVTPNLDSEYKNQETVTEKNDRHRKNAPNALPTFTNFVKHKKRSHDDITARNSQDAETNTDHARTKKAIVDSYTKRLTEPNTSKNSYYPPKMVNSKVAISIDGESEYYNVLFNQDRLTTDLNIRKTIKEMKHSKPYQYKENTSTVVNMQPAKYTSQSQKKHKEIQMSPKNESIDELPFRQFSKLCIRDSLEIFHRREENNSNIKITQTPTTQNEQIEVTEFLAPIKHYTGDDCDIVDPIERDKQIRDLLGVQNTKVLEASTQKGFTSERVNQNPDPPKCTKNQLILNRNIQVFLQVEQFTKHKPITLSRRQYEKVKRTIQTTLYKNCRSERRRNYVGYRNQHSDVSVGEIRTKRTQYTNQLASKHMQTILPHNDTFSDLSDTDLDLSDHCNLSSMSICEQANYNPQLVLVPQTDFYGADLKEKSNIHRMVQTKPNREKYNSKFVCSYIRYTNQEQQYSKQNVLSHEGAPRKEVGVKKAVDIYPVRKQKKDASNPLKQTVSSIQVHQESYTFKGITYSSSQMDPNYEPCLAQTTSFQTIFRGHRKTPTPNLGTSGFSIYSEELDSYNKAQNVVATKPKKPFLKRLMSCLVMHSKTSQMKHLVEDNPSVASSIDSYHISTSLAAAEISSSMYDTSVSFYSNHTILPIDTKMKRGFFSSVRGFLSNRRS